MNWAPIVVVFGLAISNGLHAEGVEKRYPVTRKATSCHEAKRQAEIDALHKCEADKMRGCHLDDTRHESDEEECAVEVTAIGMYLPTR